MSKQSLAWHLDCLNNIKGATDRARMVAERAQQEYLRLLQDSHEYEAQINLAIRKGRNEFDKERFGVAK